jgi:hypothetical protein
MEANRSELKQLLVENLRARARGRQAVSSRKALGILTTPPQLPFCQHQAMRHYDKAPMAIELIPRPRATASAPVYLILARAVPTIDGWIAEVREDGDSLALIEALAIHLSQRRRDFTRDESAQKPPA